MITVNTADVTASFAKLGLATLSVAYPQAGIVAGGIDVSLSVLKAAGVFPETYDIDIDNELKKCMENAMKKMKTGNLPNTQKVLLNTYIIPRYEAWRRHMASSNEVHDVDSLFLSWSNTREAHSEMYLTQEDIAQINDMFSILLKEEILRRPALCNHLVMSQIDNMNTIIQNMWAATKDNYMSLNSRVLALENKDTKIQAKGYGTCTLMQTIWKVSKEALAFSKTTGKRFAYDIIERLLPNGYETKLNLPIEGTIPNGKVLPLWDFYNKSDTHIAIIGNGGTGKTTFLYHLLEQCFNHNLEYTPGMQIPIFIELNRCPDNCADWYNDSLKKINYITRYIGTIVENHVTLDSVSDETLSAIEKELQKKPESGKPQFIFLLDGFNEVVIDEGYKIRTQLSNEISIVKEYPNVRIITTSRDTQAAYYATNFTNVRISGLTDKTIIQHLQNCKKSNTFIAEVNNNAQLMQCLRVPLYLCMFASNNEASFYPETPGEILYQFFHYNSSFYNIRKRAKETRTNPLTETQTMVVLDFILPYIGFCYERNGAFSVDTEQFEKLANQAIQATREVFENCDHNPFSDFKYSSHSIKRVLDDFTEKGDAYLDDILNALYDYLGIIYQYQTNGGTYSERVRYAFCHHSFRDYFSAIWSVQLLKMLPFLSSNTLAQVMHTGNSPYSIALNSCYWSEDKVALTSEILMEHRNRASLDIERKQWKRSAVQYDEQTVCDSVLEVCRPISKKTDVHYLLENVLSSVLFGRKELTYIDLQDWDVSHFNLYNTVCSRKDQFNIIGTNFSNALLESSCFTPQNHQDNIIEYLYFDRYCFTLDLAGIIKCWDIISGKLEYELVSGIPVGTTDFSTKGYMKIDRNGRWLGVKVQESLPNGMSLKLNLYDLQEPWKAPQSILSTGKYASLSYFAFSEKGDSVVIFFDNTNMFCYDMTGRLLCNHNFNNLYRKNEAYYEDIDSPIYIFSYDYSFTDNYEYDEYTEDIEGEDDGENWVLCAIYQWDQSTNELKSKYNFLGIGETLPTLTYLSGARAFLFYDGERNKITYLDLKQSKCSVVFTELTENEEISIPIAFYQYINTPNLCLIMYTDCCYLVDIKQELAGRNAILKQFTTAGIEKILQEKGFELELHFSTNVAPFSSRFLLFDDNAITYEWDSESDTIRTKYNSELYDTVSLSVNKDRSSVFLIHANNGISQFSKEPMSLEYQHCYLEKGYTVGSSYYDEIHNRMAMAFVDLGHEKIVLIDLDTYHETTVFSTILPNETIVDFTFSSNGDNLLITTQYKCIEYDLNTGAETIIAESATEERYVYSSYSGSKVEIVVVEESSESQRTRCEYYLQREDKSFMKVGYYIVPELSEELFPYFVHYNDFGKEGPHDARGIQKYRLSRGFFLEEWEKFEKVLMPQYYQLKEENYELSKIRFSKLEYVYVKHRKALSPKNGMNNLITIMYLDSEKKEAVLAKDSADLAWIVNLKTLTYKALEAEFKHHVGNKTGYYSWDFVVPWHDQKLMGCYETFSLIMIDSKTGELSEPIEYEPGLSLAGCNFANIHADESTMELIKKGGGKTRG